MVRRTITTEAVGRREIQPELATVEVIASGESQSASGARTAARDRARTVRESVSVVPTDATSTTNLRVRSSSERLDEALEHSQEADVEPSPAVVSEAVEVVSEVTEA